MFLISIHPQYVAAILSGAKTVECRKSTIGLARGDTLMLYATAPQKAILGRATVGEIFQDSPAALWRQCSARTQVQEADFFAYYAGAAKATLLSLTNVQKLAQPVSLAQLREVEARFSPPQTARRLSPRLQEALARFA